LEQVSAVNDEQTDAGKIELKTIPVVSAYDALIFGAPVRGASLSSVMAAYLSQAAPMQGKKAACFVTEFFPYPWMGGNRAIKQMKKICESKGAEVIGTGIINWSGIGRAKKIDDIAGKLVRLF
jgi:NAD(P)H-dependent FMN reductase